MQCKNLNMNAMQLLYTQVSHRDLTTKLRLDLDSILDSNTTKQNTQRMAPHATHPEIPHNTEP